MSPGPGTAQRRGAVEEEEEGGNEEQGRLGPAVGCGVGVQLPVLPRAAAAVEQGGSVPASAGSHVSAQTCEEEKWLLLTFLICV